MLIKSDPKIRVAVSDPKLQGKIKIDLSGIGDIDTVYWFIRFNIPLDETSVNEKSMEVTDTDGYVMRTEISYRSDDNRIVISPLDSYEEQRYYLLKVSKKVCSAKGQNLKSVISILFKLYKGQISEYKILKKDVPVPPSRPRPQNYDEMQQNREPNDLDNYSQNIKTHSKMTADSVGINPAVGIIGFVLVFAGFAIMSVPLIITAMVVCALGAAHISAQWQNKVFRAKMYYNKGVRHFNKMQYQPAKAAFERSLQLDPKNELSKYGLVRVGIYK
ncbi:MAG: tetratricopeptide repeat protein [Defluviitaleaceae bacterium]|nr:tetratricopeptide repeat protein [Defluviitaleaceae bacterium]MCL2262824.1 tetratricopeptide repeat protein [Defluviitaleaceae bacterium]